MKIWKKILTSVLAMVMMISLSNGTVLAAEDYSYTITFLAGNQGVFASTNGLSVEGANAVVTQTADKIVVSGLEAGDVVSFNAQAAVDLVETSKHYVQGVRLSGRDNNTVADSAFTVEGDKDYVVAYGIQGNMTTYTVNYQDARGREIAPSDVFYGNVGDKPVVAYKYIEGYMPRVLGFTKTLSENAADNVFTFVYDEVVVEDIIQTRPGTATPGGTFDPQTPDSDVDTDDDAQVEEDDVQTDNSDDDKKPSEIVDLDDEETPLGNVDLDDKDGSKGVPLVGMAAIAIIALVALANIIFFVKRKQNR